MNLFRYVSLAAAGVGLAYGAQSWTVRLEEPTGLYRRSGEIVRVPVTKLGGNRTGFSVSDPNGRELPWQLSTSGDLLFPASLVPGDVPEYKVYCCSRTPKKFANQIHYRTIGMRRIEFGNSRFRMVVDTGIPAIVEAYSLTAGPQRAVNLVETTPESATALKEDIHISEHKASAAVPGVEGENTGWTTLGDEGAITKVELVESGPLEARLRLQRRSEAWEFSWTANSAWVRWKARRGFRFTAVSAAPYVPFDRYLDTSDHDWPDAESTSEPENHDIGRRSYRKLPAGHAVYYQLAENYGALGIVALDSELDFTGIGSRRFIAQKGAGDTEIALTFPRWDSYKTLLEARRENRMLRQPVLARVTGPAEESTPALRAETKLEPSYKVEANAPAPTPYAEQSLSLNGAWDLAWCEKGCDRPGGEWRAVQVPGTVHVQWLGVVKAMTREAEWISYKEWWYRKKVRVPATFTGERLRLLFEATDYHADTWIDSQFVGRHEGYIDPYEYDVTGRLTPGIEHEILVRVWTPVDYYWRHRPYTVKGSYGAVDQKPDDITPLGITRSVRLVASAGSYVRDVAIDTRLVGGNPTMPQVSSLRVREVGDN